MKSLKLLKKAGNYMNPNEDRFFVKLSLIPNQPMRQTRLVFVVSLHHTGRQLTGVMAATAFALFDNYHSNDVGLDEEEGAHTFVDCTPEPFAFYLGKQYEWVDLSVQCMD